MGQGEQTQTDGNAPWPLQAPLVSSFYYPSQTEDGASHTFVVVAVVVIFVNKKIIIILTSQGPALW